MQAIWFRAAILTIIERRVASNSLAFRANPESKKDARNSKLLQQLMPEDLLKFGLIPEFIGRLPIVLRPTHAPTHRSEPGLTRGPERWRGY